MSYGPWHRDDDWEPPEPLVDNSVVYRCEDCDEEWNPELDSEYQSDPPQGAVVRFYAENAEICPECGNEGREVEA